MVTLKLGDNSLRRTETTVRMFLLVTVIEPQNYDKECKANGLHGKIGTGQGNKKCYGLEVFEKFGMMEGFQNKIITLFHLASAGLRFLEKLNKR